MFEEVDQRTAQLTDIVGRDRRRHADSDAMGTIGQQVREGGRQDHRLFSFFVIRCPKIDGVLVDTLEQQLCDVGQPCFGVAHGRRAIAVDIAEIALPVDQRIASGKFLS